MASLPDRPVASPRRRRLASGRRRSGRWAGVTVAAALVLVAGCGGPGGAGGRVVVNADGFQVVLPGRVSRLTSTEQVDGRRVAVTTWVAARGPETDAVSSAPLVGPTPTTGRVALRDLERRLDSAVLGSVEAVRGQLLSERHLTWLGEPAVDAVITTTDRLIRERVLAADGRLEVIEGLSGAPDPTFRSYLAVLSSFRLDGHRPAVGTVAAG
jgi:hypothetical protein